MLTDEKKRRKAVSDLSHVGKQHLKTPASNAVGYASQCQEVSTEETFNKKCHQSTTLSEVNIPQTLQCPLDH